MAAHPGRKRRGALAAAALAAAGVATVLASKPAAACLPAVRSGRGAGNPGRCRHSHSPQTS